MLQLAVVSWVIRVYLVTRVLTVTPSVCSEFVSVMTTSLRRTPDVVSYYQSIESLVNVTPSVISYYQSINQSINQS